MSKREKEAQQSSSENEEEEEEEKEEDEEEEEEEEYHYSEEEDKPLVQISSRVFQINHPQEDSLRISINLAADTHPRPTRSTEPKPPGPKMRHHRKHQEEDDQEQQQKKQQKRQQHRKFMEEMKRAELKKLLDNIYKKSQPKKSRKEDLQKQKAEKSSSLVAAASTPPAFLISKTRLTKEANLVSFGIEIPPCLKQPPLEPSQRKKIEKHSCGVCGKQAKYRSKAGLYSCSAPCSNKLKDQQTL